MKRFVWPLQRVLDVKVKQEQIKRSELIKLTELLAGTRNEMMRQQRKLEDIMTDISVKQANRRLGEQEFFLRNCSVTDERIRQLKDKVLELELQHKNKIAEVLQVRRFRKGLERLRTEAKRAFIEEQEKLDQQELDESTTISFARKVLQR